MIALTDRPTLTGCPIGARVARSHTRRPPSCPALMAMGRDPSSPIATAVTFVCPSPPRTTGAPNEPGTVVLAAVIHGLDAYGHAGSADEARSTGSAGSRQRLNSKNL